MTFDGRCDISSVAFRFAATFNILLKYKKQAMYRERRKRHPSNPKSRNDVFEALRGLRVKSSKGENLLQVIDSDHGIVIFTTMTNLNFLCSDISELCCHS
jgi:hypothetical protein